MLSALKVIYRKYKNLTKVLVLSFVVSVLVVRYFDGRDGATSRMWWKSRRNYPLSRRSNHSPSEQAYAYASLLCDDVMIDATKVLINSLKSTTNLPFILLVLPQVRQTADLIKLGAKIQVISELEYPFKVNQEKIAINKMCRYSKLHIWKFIQYKKIIFIDVDCLIVQSLDKAFKWPEFSAVRDAGDTFNTGLFVLEPSLKTYDEMIKVYLQAPSYNQGDQGFLNWFFRNSVKMALPVKYNTVCKHKTQAIWPLLKLQSKMIHYTSETKPWNFFIHSHKYWKQNFDASMFYLWAKAYRNVAEKLRIDVFDPTKAMWINSKRVPELCDRFAPIYEGLRKSHQDEPRRLSVVLIKWRSIEGLLGAIEHYRTSLAHIVARVYVSWNPSYGLPPAELNKYKFIKSSPLVEILFHRLDSPNNIWNPIHNLPTRAIFMANDEHLPDAEKIEIAFESWYNNQNGIVGFFARYHGKQKIIDFDIYEAIVDEETNPPVTSTELSIPSTTLQNQATAPFIVDESWQWSYNLTSIRRPRPYSLLSSNLMLLNSDYLFTYTCLLPEKIHRYVDEQAEDSADLSMNLLVAGMTGNKPLLVKSDFTTDPESPKYDSAWGALRAQMLRDLIKLMNGGTKDPLNYNALIVGQYNRIPFKKKSPKQWYN